MRCQVVNDGLEHPMVASLPSPQEDQPFFKVKALDAGYLTGLEIMLVNDVDPKSKIQIPSLSFLLQHSSNKQNILFDLGIKKRLPDYSPATQKLIDYYLMPASGDPGVLDSLHRLGLKAEDINLVIISHLHW